MPKRPNNFVFWAKTLVLAGLLTYIGYTLHRQPVGPGGWAAVGRQLLQAHGHPVWLLVLLALTPVNWGLEALKWQILARRVEPLSFADAFRGVLAGLSLGFALPAQLGDTAGRVLSLRSGQRGAAIGASLVAGGMQFYVALVFGALAWAVHLRAVPERNTPAGRALLAGLVAVSALGVVLNFLRKPLVSWLVHQAEHPPLRSGSARSEPVPLRRGGRWSAWLRPGHYVPYWRVMGQYSHAEIGWALGAASLRYLTFGTQFLAVLYGYGLALPTEHLLAGVGLVFLAKTVTPAFNLLSDLGVREAAALWVFAPFGLPVPLVLATTLTLWLVNILLPVLVGLIWVWRLRITTT